MAEVGVEQAQMGRVDRIKQGIGQWVENQMPPAVAERYKKTFSVFADKLSGKNEELRQRLQGPVERAAKIAGWADPMIKVAVGAAALYGGVQVLIHPEILTAVGAKALAMGQTAYIIGATAAERGFSRIKNIVGNIVERVK